MKYLINVDRNSRRQHVIIFGVKEDETLKIGDKTTVADLEKRDLIFEYLKLTDLLIIESIRLGKEETGKPRPLKITFPTNKMASTVLKNSHKLNNLKAEGQVIYIKPDKSKSEVTEFQRLGKKKQELLKQYPTVDENNPRVILKKGSLKVDGVEVDKYQPVQSLF